MSNDTESRPATSDGYGRRVRSVVAPETEADRERRRIVLLSLPYFVLAVFGAFVPIAVMVRMSVSDNPFFNEGFSLAAWETVLTEPIYREVAFNTLWFAAATTVVSVGIAIAIAHTLEKYDLPYENVFEAIISFPIALPGIVVGFMIVVLFGRTGLLTNAVAFFTGGNRIDLAIAVSLSGLFLGFAFSLVPRATMVMRGAFAEINTDAEEAARALGAGSLSTFYHVTFPQVLPGVVAALILSFRTALAIFGTVLVLPALTVATLQISNELSPDFNTQIAAVIGLVYFVFFLVFTFLSLNFIDGEQVRL